MMSSLAGEVEAATSPGRHGNCEMMRDPATGGPHTAHTTNPVPVVVVDGGNASLSDGRLADIAPTLLALMGLPQPKEMTGKSLLK